MATNELIRNRPDYQHDPLDHTKRQTRLIKLYRELSEDGLIQCEVRTFDASEKPEYQAISYVWGSETPNCAILINEAQHTVRVNLWHFLDIFRLERNHDGLLWIDQISIDQQNVSERNHQVQLMGDTFRNASQVVAWLGLSPPGYISIEFSVGMHELTCNVWQEGHEESMQDHKRQIGDELKCLICEARTERDRMRLHQPGPVCLTRLRYWKRLWIVQEVMLAKDIIFFWGNQKIDLQTMRQYIHLVYHPNLHVETLLNGPSQNLPLDFSLPGLLDILDPADLACTDPRDLVFGLIGLLHPTHRIEVDYNLKNEDVFGLLLEEVMISLDP